MPRMGVPRRGKTGLDYYHFRICVEKFGDPAALRRSAFARAEADPDWRLQTSPDVVTPVAFGDKAVPPGMSNPSADAANDRLTKPSRRILVVEDEAFIALDACAILEKAGYDVAGTAAIADDAVALAEQLRPELVLMDIRLLGQRDGIDAAIEIRQRLGIPSLFLSAHDDERTRQRAASAEPIGFVSKPFSERALLNAVALYFR